MKPEGSTPERKESDVLAQDEHIPHDPHHASIEPPALDAGLQQTLALLEPDDSLVPSSRRALQAFRDAHYQAPTPQKVEEAQAVQKPPGTQEPIAIHLPWHKRVTLWLGLDRQTQGLLWVAGAAAAMVVMFVFPLAQQPFVTPEWAMKRSEPSPRAPGSTRKAPAVGHYLGKGQVQWKMLYAPVHGQPDSAVPAQPTKLVGAQQRLAPGDLVQFVYQLPQAAHLMILNIDHKGTISACTPFQGRSSLLVRAGQGTLPKGGSMELDQSRGYERFVVVFAKQAFSLAQVQQAFRVVWQRAGGDLRKVDQIPGPWSMRSYLIYKEERPRRRGAP